MQSNDLLRDAFERVRDLTYGLAEGLDAEALAHRPEPDANPIGWLLWHITRLQDDHVGELMGVEQLWANGDWAAGFGLEPDTGDIGYGHTSEQVATVRPSGPEAIVDYHEAVAARTLEWLDTIGPDDLDRVVDRSYDPPVTAGVRLVSVLSDSFQHLGQAGYVRGLR